LRDQCQSVGVPFLFKQWGEWLPCVFRMDAPDSKPYVFPDGQLVMRVGVRKGGRLLDGREWLQFPESR
jgi:protein gp37